MLGFRGASRYIAPEFYECFALECAAMKRVRDDMGLTNVEIMIPFVRTLTEAEKVIALLGEQRLEARRERPARHHDVRDCRPTPSSPSSSSSTSTAFRSAPTT